MPHSLFDSFQLLKISSGKSGHFYSLPQLEKKGLGPISRLPVSIRIVLESVLRNFDGTRITEQNVRDLAGWKPQAGRTEEIPFVVARILLQDFTGVPLLVDLAAMRSAVAKLGKKVEAIEPSVRVDLVIDHSVQVDVASTSEAFQKNMEMEFYRNKPRYQFLKWGMQAFHNFHVIPPGIGICHQVNLEYLAAGVQESNGIFYPDSLVGTDSHTTMINGLGVVGWGVGGIEAEAGMLGQPVYFLTPDVVGVHMSGKLREGVTATDLVLHVTEMLRKAKVVGKFVEYFGEGAASLAVTDRATLANMSPEYGATMGYFPVDEETCSYYLATGRSPERVNLIREYFKAQGMFGIPRLGQCDYTQVLELPLEEVQPGVAGPKRPQDHIPLPRLKEKFFDLLQRPVSENGYNKPKDQLQERYPVTFSKNGSGPVKEISSDLGHGDVLIAAITSCTNTSNPSVMLAAGLLAKKAVEKGLSVNPKVKTSLAPGSRVVTDYLAKTGLQPYLDQLGFNLVGYGCTTCIGNSGPLNPDIESVVTGHDVVTASVLSGNRNFEARIHPNIKANFLMSPPLVVAFALAGTVEIDLANEPLGHGKKNEPVYLRDIWPSSEEIRKVLQASLDAETYRRRYSDFSQENPLWNEIPSPSGAVYQWDRESTYIQEPPFFSGFPVQPKPVHEIHGARPLAVFGDSITTDHISPAGSIKSSSPAGRYLQERGVAPVDFNSYGSRRGNDRVMTRGTFANVRIKNLMTPGIEGGVTLHLPEAAQMSIYDAAMKYKEEDVPLMVFAGQEYGSGSSRDWAAKGTLLLGVKAVVAQSFERIHRSNLVQMGVLPCQFQDGSNSQMLHLNGTEIFDLVGYEKGITPRKELTLVIHRADGTSERVPVIARIDTHVEVEYFRHGGILPYMLRQLAGKN
ncbi:MAG: aconitate hydratase AcnA [Acidobacteriia bacterium]|nr:aconitate hydratase AcnA [Terriglobia bacterium]